MRPKFVFVVLVLAAVGLAGIVLLRPRPAVPVTANVSTRPVPDAPAAPAPAQADTAPPSPPPVAVRPALTPEQQQDAIFAEKERLYALAMDKGQESLSNIEAALSSPEQEIRETAVNAVKELGDSNAIPFLKNLAANTDDEDEAIALLQAAKFLSYPPLDLNVPAFTNTPEEDQINTQRAAARAARAKAAGQ